MFCSGGRRGEPAPGGGGGDRAGHSDGAPCEAPGESREGVLGVIQSHTKSQRGFRGGKHPVLPTELTTKGVKPAQARRSAALGWSFSLFSRGFREENSAALCLLPKAISRAPGVQRCFGSNPRPHQCRPSPPQYSVPAPGGMAAPS